VNKHKKALYKRSDEIDRELDNDPKPKKRDRLLAEQREVMTELAKLQKKSKPIVVPEFETADAEAGKRHLAHLERLGELQDERAELDKVATDDTNKKKVIKAANERITEIDNAILILREATAARTLEVAHETTGRNLKSIKERTETDDEIKARVLAKRAERLAEIGVAGGGEFPETAMEREARLEASGQLIEPADEVKATRDAAGEDTIAGQTEREAAAIHIEDEPVVLKKKPKGDPAEREFLMARTAEKVAQVNEAIAKIDEVAKTVTELHEIHVKDSLIADQAATGISHVVVEPEGLTLIDPEEVQPRDRWGRPEIVRPDGTVKGYRRMTTFIDVIDDKDNLVKWKGRVILAGVAATEQKIAGDTDLLDIDAVGVESIIERVEAANQEMEAAVKHAKKQHKKSRINETELQTDLDAAEKAHRNALSDLAEEAFQAGDGYLKAETGTRIHKLTEYVDRGEDLPEDATDTERRDIAAYVAARDALGVEVKLIEQFVVIDELEVGGTLDRLIRIDSPSLGRRVTAIGDVKTGRMDFGAGKMARQLAGYARGKKYDWRDPEHTRTAMRANQEVGYIFNVPAGQGVCFVYELDLKLGAKGLKLCKDIFDYRAETSTLKKVGTLIHETKKE
jgi:hypothetical protein